ncbi:MAG: hypothetical protein QXP36_00250 [Conexivisphaerales archaeon]
MDVRKGVALITVILISTMLFVSSFILINFLQYQRKTTSIIYVSDKALASAEAGLSKVVSDIRNVDFLNNRISNTNDPYVPVYQIKQLVRYPPYTYTILLPEKMYNLYPDTFYQAKVIRVSKGDVDGWDPDNTTDGTKRVYVAIFVKGYVKKNGNIVSERAIYSEAFIDYYKKTTNIYTTVYPNSPAFSFGLFSGSDISFSGNALVVNGNIFSDGNVDLGTAHKVRVSNGNVYAVGTISGNGTVTNGQLIPNQSPIEFPIVNVDYYKALAQAFKLGLPPYDGSVSRLPNTSNPSLRTIVQYYLGTNSQSSFNAVTTFISDMLNKRGAFTSLDVTTWQQLIQKAQNIVYYVPDPVVITSKQTYTGTIIVDNSLSIHGNVTINTSGGVAIICTQNVNIANGNATINGVLYSQGTVTGLGNLTVNGGIVSRNALNVSGSCQINYVPYSFNTLAIAPSIQSGSSVLFNGVTNVEISNFSWREISIDDYNNTRTQ